MVDQGVLPPWERSGEREGVGQLLFIEEEGKEAVRWEEVNLEARQCERQSSKDDMMPIPDTQAYNNLTLYFPCTLDRPSFLQPIF